MKKGLLSILAVALTLVGCQNYDDQFADLNTKIANLQTSIAGLATVGADVAALKATVGGLATAAQTDALSSGLATAQADLDAIETALASVASAADLTAVKTQLSTVESDVKELLAANSVINQTITINSLPTLQYAETLVSTDPTDPNVIVNGNVIVTLSDSFLNTAGVDLARISAVTNKIATVLGTSSGGKLALTGTYSKTTSPGDLEFNNLSFVDTDLVLSATTFPKYPKLTTVTGNASLTSAGDVDFQNVAVTGNVEIGTGATAVNLTGSTAAAIKTTTDALGELDLDKAVTIDVGTANVTSINADVATSIKLGKAAALANLSVTASSVTTLIDIAATSVTGTLTIAGTSTDTVVNAKSATSIGEFSVASVGELHLTAATALGSGTAAALVLDVNKVAAISGFATFTAAKTFQAEELSQTLTLTLADATTVHLKSGVGLHPSSNAVGAVNMPAVKTLKIFELSISNSVSLTEYATLESADIKGKKATAPLDTNQKNGVVVGAGAAALKSLSVSGWLNEVNVDEPASTLAGITSAGEIKSFTVSGTAGLLSTSSSFGHDHVEGMVGASFRIINCDKLDKVVATNLREIKALEVSNNLKVASIDFTGITIPEGDMSASTLMTTITNNGEMSAVMTKHEAATETTPAVPATITGTDGLFGLKSYLGNYLGTGTATSSFRLDTKIVIGSNTASSTTDAFAADNATGNKTSGAFIDTADELALIGS
jgi:hypothetical protein